MFSRHGEYLDNAIICFFSEPHGLLNSFIANVIPVTQVGNYEFNKMQIFQYAECSIDYRDYV